MVLCGNKAYLFTGRLCLDNFGHNFEDERLEHGRYMVHPPSMHRVEFPVGKTDGIQDAVMEKTLHVFGIVNGTAELGYGLLLGLNLETLQWVLSGTVDPVAMFDCPGPGPRRYATSWTIHA